MSERVVHIENGKIANPAAIRKQFNELRDGMYLVKVSPRKVRSLSQNAYYWAVVCGMVRDGLRDAGYDDVLTDEDAHEVMKHLFLKKDIVNKKTDESIPSTRSTTELTTFEFSNYIEQIITWAAQYLNIVIPYPNEY
ncbi:hypothetical protein [Chitinophaga sancti]|uniref:NinB protein n=1 Tax=Chitinophaga sancti TaxID=1004 RepID=A0A1K1M0D8_9BACT|nr:hypothetical protein [Chitinophaga sancti]WQD64721.1 hypothetical protein U0033_09970 [Chitinophaga sancti]WQG89657.1 hypothetical protein SR876_32505 [Chitinophaga sancti]SFW16594.1 hypothetical protein SAMN05661012_00349 [Chitinophaga sancti]